MKNGYSAPFAQLNRGKKGLIADLKTPEGKVAAWDLSSAQTSSSNSFVPA